MPLLTPIQESSKKPLRWLFSSDFPTALSYSLASRRASRRQQPHYAVPLDSSHTSPDDYRATSKLSDVSDERRDDEVPVDNSREQGVDEEINEATTINFATRLKIQFLKAFGIDGLNTATNQITCADGTVAEYSSNSLPFRFVITSLLGMPNRPETVIDGVPQLSFKQFLRNWIGGWTPIRAQKQNYQSLDHYIRDTLADEASKKRWTTKKVVQIFAIPFKIVILLFKIATLPFKILLNAVKLVTEFALPLISFYLAVLPTLMVEGISWLYFEARKPAESNEWGDDDELPPAPQYSKWKIGLFFAGLIPMIAATLAVLVFQYATVLLCRAGRALTSPAESARRAYALGRSVKIGEIGSRTRTVISYIMGILGLIVSLGVSALLWTLALPFALSTVTTWIPSLINAINWIAQLPAVSATLTWISSTSFATGSMVLLNNLFATVGTALNAAFGPAITAMAGVISVQVPAVVLAVGTTLGMLAMPVAALFSLGADKLSNLWAQWTIESPLSFLRSLKMRGNTSTQSTASPFSAGERYIPLEVSAPLNAQRLTFMGVLHTYEPKYRSPSSKESPLEIVVSPIALDLAKNDHLVERAVYLDSYAKRVFDLASTTTNPNERGGFRLPTSAELSDFEIRVAPASSSVQFIKN